MDTLLQDIRYGLRTLARQPGFTAVAVLTLALGVGANTAIFSVIDASLLARLPFPDGDRLAMLWLDNSRLGIRTDITSYPNFADTRDQATVFEELAGFSPTRVNLTGDGEPVRLPAARMMASAFSVLKVEAARGRTFSPAEDLEGSSPVVVLSHALWQGRYGGAEDILERTLEIGDEAFAVVGVMPPGFDFPDRAQLWLPMRLSERAQEARGSFWLYQVGRLAPGVELAAAQAEMDSVATRLRDEHEFMAGYGLYLQPLREHFVGDARRALLVLLGAVGFVLVLACANVAHLLLARAVAREREISLRSALGAGGGRLVRQLLTETAVLTLAGTGLGVAFAAGGLRGLAAWGPEAWTRLEPASLDLRVLAFTLGLALLTGLAVGLLPAFQGTRVDLASALKEGGRGTGSRGARLTRSALVVAEVGVALVLLIGAGLLIRSFDRLLAVDPGLRTSGILTVDLPASRAAFPESPQVASFFAEVIERAAALPGVESAAATSTILLPELAMSGTISIEGKPDPPREERIEVTFDAVTPGYFSTIGMELIAGRDVASTDGPDGEQVAVVNAAMAHRYWPGEEAVGRRFKSGDQDSESPWIRVVGVVADARRTALEKAARPSCWAPHQQFAMRTMTLVVASSIDPERLAAPLRDLVREIHPDQPLGAISTVAEQIDARLAQRRFNTLLFGVFSALALVLALVGVYGVVAQWVSESTREIGVRMALGARSGDVLRWILGRGLGLVGLGLVLGIAAALLLVRFLDSLLYATSAFDGATFAAMTLLLVAVAILAGAVPALRATRVHPTEVLRYE